MYLATDMTPLSFKNACGMWPVYWFSHFCLTYHGSHVLKKHWSKMSDCSCQFNVSFLLWLHSFTEVILFLNQLSNWTPPSAASSDSFYFVGSILCKLFLSNSFCSLIFVFSGRTFLFYLSHVSIQAKASRCSKKRSRCLGFCLASVFFGNGDRWQSGQPTFKEATFRL